MLEQELKQEPLFVGISSKTGVQLKNALNISTFIKERSSTPIVFGGVHMSLLPEQSIQCDLIDFGIVGEGEETMLELVNAFNEDKSDDISNIQGIIFKRDGQVVMNPRRKLLDMETLPINRFDAVDAERYIFKNFALFSDRELCLGETSRGCHWNCGYCYNLAFYGRKWRSMSKEKTIEMIQCNVEKYKLKSIWIRDDNFFVDIPRAAAVVEYIAQLDLKVYFPGITVQEFKRMPEELRQNLKKIGGTMIRFGVESGSDRMLRLIDKGITPEDVYKVNRECKSLDLIPSYNFMIGFPRERKEDVFTTIEMMKKLKRENPKAQLANINNFTPYPGTNLFDIYKQDYPDDVPKTVYDWVTFHHLNVKKGDIDANERHFYENIVDVSYFISDPFYQSLPTLVKIAYFPLRAWFLIRWRFNAFRVAPEIVLLRRLKNWFFSID